MISFPFFLIIIVSVINSFSKEIDEFQLKKMHLYDLSEFSSLYIPANDYDISLSSNINSTVLSNLFTIINSSVNIYCQEENCEIKIINSSFQLFSSSLNFYGIKILILRNSTSLFLLLTSNSYLSIQVNLNY